MKIRVQHFLQAAALGTAILPWMGGTALAQNGTQRSVSSSESRGVLRNFFNFQRSSPEAAKSSDAYPNWNASAAQYPTAAKQSANSFASFREPAPVVEAEPLVIDPSATSAVYQQPYESAYTCREALWVHRNGVFADVLVLRPGNVDIVYAQEVTGPTPADSPTGPLGRAGIDTQVGYRVGMNHAMTDCSSLQFAYTWFDSDTTSNITAGAGNVLALTVGDPSIANVGATSIASSADYRIAFQQIDLDYRGLLYGSCDSALNYSVGLRYANLDQEFMATQDVGVPAGLSTVATDIDFDGFGIGFGLDGMRRSTRSGMLVYAKGSASFVSGEYKADFLQTTQFGGGVAATTLEDFRVMTILQTELGVGWQSDSGRIRLTVGYQTAGWFNALTTASFIDGVQDRNFADLYETISFDGFVGRAEYRF